MVGFYMAAHRCGKSRKILWDLEFRGYAIELWSAPKCKFSLNCVSWILKRVSRWIIIMNFVIALHIILSIYENYWYCQMGIFSMGLARSLGLSLSFSLNVNRFHDRMPNTFKTFSIPKIPSKKKKNRLPNANRSLCRWCSDFIRFHIKKRMNKTNRYNLWLLLYGYMEIYAMAIWIRNNKKKNANKKR